MDSTEPRSLSFPHNIDLYRHDEADADSEVMIRHSFKRVVLLFLNYVGNISLIFSGSTYWCCGEGWYQAYQLSS
jgi:hypothetical protein